MAKELSEILVEQGTLTPEQIKRSELYARQNNTTLAEAIVLFGFATEEQVTSALAKHFSLPYASRENGILMPEREQNLQKLIPEKFARENLVIPLFIEDNELAVALYDPSNLFLIDNIRMMAGKEVQTFVASKSQILAAVDSFYGHKNLLDEVVRETGSAKDAVATATDEDVQIEGGSLDLDKSSANSSQYIKLVNAILKQAISERTSDIHLEMFDERVSLRFRIDGSLYERTPPNKDSVAAIISRIKILSKLDIAEKRLPQDGSFSIKYQNRTIEVRVSVCPAVYGEKLVLRILDRGTGEMNVDKLGFEPEQKKAFLEAANLPHGLIFLTGPTGSGKSTTLNAVLTTIRTPELNFMTLEDPVEYKLAGISQVQVKPQIGLTFAAGLRSFLRQDPDVILVGEVRDSETAEACLKATNWLPADRDYFRGGGFSSNFLSKGGMPVTMSRLNQIKGLGPVLQIAEGWTADVDPEIFDVLNKRTDPTWPTTWFVPRLCDKPAFRDVYSVMNNWGANHGAISYGHIGADLITLASMLRIPVCMHNVDEDKIFRPAAWNAFGMDKEGADFRACKNYGPIYK